MPRRLDEEQAAMYASILDIAFALSCKLFSQVSRVLVFDVFDDGVPTVFCQ